MLRASTWKQRIYVKVAAWLILFLGLAGQAQATTYYISYASGSNSNNGTSTATPWKTAPYMVHGGSCDSSGPTYTHATGDKFAFKGGDTWPAACFGMNITAGGTSGTQDYYGVCLSSDSDSPCSGGTSWPSSGWTKPIFDMANQVPAGGAIIYDASSSIGYITIDNLDLRRQQYTVNASCYQIVNAGSGSMVNLSIGWQGVIVENSFLHDWMANVASLTSSWVGDYYPAICGFVTSKHNEISDANGSPIIFGSCWRNVNEVNGDNCHDAGQGTTGFASVHDSQIHNLNGINWQNQTSQAMHTNGLEVIVGSALIYNNLMYGNQTGTNILVGAPNSTDDIYNNVIYGNSAISIAEDTTSTGGETANVYNNTVDCSNGVFCFRVTNHTGNPPLSVLNLRNNLWITNGTATCYNNTGSGCANVTTLTDTPNYLMSTSEANTNGFTQANLYAPTSSDSNVAGAGINLSSLCSGNLAAVCSDARGAPWYGHSYVSRGWDLGAYVGTGTGSGGGGLASPSCSPGSGGYGASQSVTCTLPSGSTGCYTLNGTTPAGSSGTCTNGTTYSGAISITQDETLEILATESGFSNSSVVSYAYQIGPILLVQYAENTNCAAGSSCTVTMASNCVAGTCGATGSSHLTLIFAISLNGSTQNHLSSATDAGGTADTYSSCTALGGQSCNAQGGSVGNVDIFSSTTGNSGNTSFTCNLASSNTHSWGCGFIEVSSALSGWSFDASNSLGNPTSLATQNGVALSIRGSHDFVLELGNASTSIQSVSLSGNGGNGGYYLSLDSTGNAVAFIRNVSSVPTPAYTLSSAGNLGAAAIAFATPFSTPLLHPALPPRNLVLGAH